MVHPEQLLHTIQIHRSETNGEKDYRAHQDLR